MTTVDTVTTDRLVLREFVDADAEALHRLRTDPQVMRWTGEPPLTGGIEAARAAIADYPDFREHGFGRWACELRETGAVVGFCGLKFLDDLGEVDIGYRFVPEHWGRGLATESARACLEYGFGPLALPKIIAMVLPGNAGSIRVLDKLGMERVEDRVEDGLGTVWCYEARREQWPRDAGRGA